MFFSRKEFFITLLQSLFFWIVAFLFFGLIRFGAAEEQFQFLYGSGYESYLDNWYILAISLGAGVGFFYAIIEVLFDLFLLKRMAILLSVFLKTFIYLILIIVVASLATHFIEEEFDLDLPNELGWWKESTIFWILMLYFIVASLVFSFIKISNKKFGKGVFLKLLFGQYIKPKEERRIFMFLDLKDSTTIAEKLGHTVYSRFIQDCFFDLNKVLQRYNAEVYQYVGDEAVLSWPFNEGKAYNQCVKIFFAFHDQIHKRKEYYEERYKEVPVFKAGLHGGKIMIAEVGIVKKEIAFHGDVINTTARIQSQCNAHNSRLLISDSLLKRLNLRSPFTMKDLGQFELKGKEEMVNIFSIQKEEASKLTV